MTEKQAQVVGMIDRLENRGRLESTLQEYVDKEIRRGRSFYPKMLATKGRDAAEKALEAWIDMRHLREFSAAIKPVALGIRRLAEADAGGKWVTIAAAETARRRGFPLSYQHGGDVRLIVALNPEWSGCGCGTPEGFQQFAQMGELGLRAITLAVSADEQVELGLMFHSPDRAGHGFTTITVAPHGYTHNKSINLRLAEDAYTQYALGLADHESLVMGTSMSGGDPSQYLGFPGSDRYLATNIGKLGEYLSGMAEHILHAGKGKHG